MKEYYARRAAEYEAIYHRDDPIRQAEQREIALAMRRLLDGRHVLEIACGTGYWTQLVADVAASVVAIDTAEETLAIARAKGLPEERVTFLTGDAYTLAGVPGDFDAGLANFWLSHAPKARLGEFLGGFHKRVGPGSVLFMADNVNVPGVGGELVSKPGAEDTFKVRTLSDGSVHEVLKNYYTHEQLESILSPWTEELRVHVGACFWWVEYRVPGDRR